MFYSDNPLDATTWLGSQGSISESIQYVDELLQIPDNTKYIALNCTYNGILKYKKGIIDHSKSTEELYNFIANFNNVTNLLTIKTKDNIEITIGPGGANNLIDFRTLLKQNTFAISNTTDWFMPYKIRAINNIDGDLPENWYSHFTGGNHGYNNSGSGSTKTARGVLQKIYFNNTENFIVNEDIKCNTIDLYWTNYVQASNTKKQDGTGREVLKENYHLHFNGDKFIIDHNFVPLEDLIIITYYGFGGWLGSDAICFFTSGELRSGFSLPSNSNCGNKKCKKIILNKNNYNFNYEMDNLDLGNFEILNDQTFSAFSSGTKIYFSLINLSNSSTVISQNNYYYDRRYFYITPNLL